MTETNQTQQALNTQIVSPRDEELPMVPKLQEAIPKITYLSLFKDTTKSEKIMMVIGASCALASGAGLPLFSLVFGNLTNSLGPTPSGVNSSIVDQAATMAPYFVYIGLGIFVCLGLSMSIYLSLCEKVSCRIRKAYFRSLMNQEIGWFDILNPNELAAKVALDTQTVQKGIGESIPTFFMSLATVIGAFIMGFSRGWELSLVLMGALPLIAFAGGLFAYVLTSIKHLVDIAYVHAGGLAEQSLNAIKTVKALCAEDFELHNFTLELRKGVKVIKRFGVFAGTAIGFLFFCFFSDHGLGFWFGAYLIDSGRENVVAGRPYNVGDVITIFICITMGSMILAQVPPPVKSFVQAKDSGANIFYVIERKPKISINDQTKRICEKIEGDIIFKDVEFNYPSRPTQSVLKKVNIEIMKNKKTAFVGESGSGKSTLVALIERFYDPNSGGVYLDGVDIRQFNLNSLRKKIGYVGQEPVMFSGTIKENLLYGKGDATEEELLAALKKAEAYKFVMEKDKKMDTYIGIGGGQLSGGQKQRIAIARAILKDPPILLLDEATSALDRENEMAIQKTLDSIAGGRTTVVVAHRLTTIQDADRIYVMNNGEVAEYGTHQELLNLHGKYEALVKLQLTQNQEEKRKHSEVNEIVLKKNSFYGTSFHEKKKDEKHEEKNLEKMKESQEKKLKEEIEKLKKTGELKKKTKKVFRRLFTDYIFKHWFHCLVVYSFSLMSGAVQPLMAILMGNIMENLVLITFESEKVTARENINFYSGMFAVLGAAALIANAMSSFLFTLLGEKISMELKTKTYDITLRREMSYFDKAENNPGIISSRISFETQNINRLISSFFGVVFNGIGAFVCGIVLSFAYSWQIALLALGLSPILVIGQLVQGKIHTGFAKEEEAYNEAGAIVMEAAINIRTVASFCNEEVFIKKFNDKINQPMVEAGRKGIISGFGFGFSQLLMFSFFAVMFYVAAVLQDKEGLSLKGFFISLFAIIQAAGATGSSSNFLPDVGESVISAEKIFDILDAKNFENYKKPADLKGVEFKGHISVKNIWFKYPNADKYLFENFSLEIPAGKKIAFVGPSGCGKSTLFQLLMNFYPVEKGDISIDGVSIYSMDVKQLRSIYGVVSQEPTLFQGTVAFNIKYNSDATMQEIREAAEKANALKFIESNQFDIIDDKNNSPLKKDKSKAKTKAKKDVEEKDTNTGMGFDRQVGSKGSQISGGQKQRIAIARAIIKNPKILLLDEATSALDAQNEAIVQDSLNRIMTGKTSVVIAHRISTIRDSDEILMFGEGKIVERGKYEDLVSNRGVFYKFERGFGDK